MGRLSDLSRPRWAAVVGAALLVAACGPATAPAGPDEAGATDAPPTTTSGTAAPPTGAASSAPATAGGTAAPTSAARGTASTAATSTGTSPGRGLAGTTIVIDPGHNGANGANPQVINRQVDIGNRRKECDTTGTATASGYRESAYTFDVARRLQAILEAGGARVVLTRPSDDGVGPCIDERARIGNEARADAAVSIHADGGPPGGTGFHVIRPLPMGGPVDPVVDRSAALARALRTAFAAGTGTSPATYLATQDGVVARDDLGGLNLSTVPKVFIETGNMRNASDAALLTDPGFRQREAQALADGLTRFLSGG